MPSGVLIHGVLTARLHQEVSMQHEEDEHARLR